MLLASVKVGGCRRDAAQDLAQLQAGPQAHCGPQGQAAGGTACVVCVAAGWQPQVQPVPGQVLQVQGVGLVLSFMVVSLVRCIDDGLSSMAALSAPGPRGHSTMRPAVGPRAGTVAGIDRAVAGRLRPLQRAQPMPAPAFEQAMQWHPNRTREPGLRWLRGPLQEAAATLSSRARPQETAR